MGTDPILVFDLDGTLSDPAEGIARAINYGLRKLGLPEEEPTKLTCFIGPPLDRTFAELLGCKEQDTIAEAIRLFREYYGRDGYRESTLYPGVLQVLQMLRQAGMSLHIATTKRTDIARRTIDHLGIQEFFDSLQGGGTSRSKTDLLRDILQEEGRDLIMIGDRSFDMAAGKEMGGYCVGALWGFGSRAELLQSGADVLCRDFKSLPGCLPAASI